MFPDDLKPVRAQAMERPGLSPADAAISARVLATTDSWGVHTHGTRQIRPLMRTSAMVGSTPRRGRRFSGGAGFAVVDSSHAMPTVTACYAMDTAIRKAKEAGIAYVGVTQSSHFGAAGYYATLALRHDMIGMAMTNTDPVDDRPGRQGADHGNESHRLRDPGRRQSGRSFWTSPPARSR